MVWVDGVGVRRLELLHGGKKLAEMAARNEEAAEHAPLLVLLLIKLHPRVSRGGCALRDGLSSVRQGDTQCFVESFCIVRSLVLGVL